MFAGLAIGASRVGDPVWLLACRALALQTVRHTSTSRYAAPQQRGDERRASAAARAGRSISRGRSRRGAPHDHRPAAAAPHARAAARCSRLVARSTDVRVVRWLKRMVAFPIGERFAVISITAALFTPRMTFVALLAWGGFAIAYTHSGRILRCARDERGRGTRPPARRTATTGPLARALGRARPASIPAPGRRWTLAGLAPCCGRRARRRRRVASGRSRPCWPGRCSPGAPRSARPAREAGWSEPPLCGSTEYVALIWLAALRGPDALPGRLRAARRVAFHNYDPVYRLRHQGVAPPAWVGLPGWDGRLVAAFALLALGRAAGRVLRGRGRALGAFVGRGVPRAGCARARRRSRSLRGRGGRRSSDRHGARGGRGEAARPRDADCPRRCCRSTASGRSSTSRSQPRAVGLESVVIVTATRAERVERRARARATPRVAPRLVYNPKALEWNNAYSLWCARDAFAEGVLLVNGDTVHPASVEEALLAARGPRGADRRRRRQAARRGGDEGPHLDRGLPGPHQQGAGPGDRAGRVHRRHADRAGRRGLAGRRAGGDLAARPAALLRGRLPGARRPRRARGDGADRRGRVGRGRRRRATSSGRGRSRAAADPHGRHAARGRHRGRRGRRTSRRCSPTGGSPAAATSRSSSAPGSARRSRRCCGPADQRRDLARRGRLGAGRRRARHTAAARLLRRGGRASAAAARSTSPSTPRASPACRWSPSPPASPMTASLRPSPRSKMTRRAARGPTACRCRSPSSSTSTTSPQRPAMRRSGIGDAISNLSAIADWRLAARERGEAVDGVAVDVRADRRDLDHPPRGRHRGRRVPDRARRGARAVRAGDGGGREAAGRAAAATTRSCTRSTRCYPGTAHHGELAGGGQPLHVVPARRRRPRARHRHLPAPARVAAYAGRPRAERGAVRRGRRARPETRPDRFTILEHLGLDGPEVRRQVAAFLDAYAS